MHIGKTSARVARVACINTVTAWSHRWPRTSDGRTPVRSGHTETIPVGMEPSIFWVLKYTCNVNVISESFVNMISHMFIIKPQFLVKKLSQFVSQNMRCIDKFQIHPVRALPHWNRGPLCQVTTPMRGRQLKRLTLPSYSACVNTENLVIKPGSAQIDVNFVNLKFVYYLKFRRRLSKLRRILPCDTGVIVHWCYKSFLT